MVLQNVIAASGAQKKAAKVAHRAAGEGLVGASVPHCRVPHRARAQFQCQKRYPALPPFCTRPRLSVGSPDPTTPPPPPWYSANARCDDKGGIDHGDADDGDQDNNSEDEDGGGGDGDVDEEDEDGEEDGEEDEEKDDEDEDEVEDKEDKEEDEE